MAIVPQVPGQIGGVPAIPQAGVYPGAMTPALAALFASDLPDGSRYSRLNQAARERLAQRTRGNIAAQARASRGSGLAARIAQRQAALQSAGLTAAIDSPRITPGGTMANVPRALPAPSAIPAPPAGGWGMSGITPPQGAINTSFAPPGPGAGQGGIPIPPSGPASAAGPGASLVPRGGPNWQSGLGGRAQWMGPTSGAMGAPRPAPVNRGMALPAAGQTGRPGPATGRTGFNRGSLLGSPSSTGAPGAAAAAGGANGWWRTPVRGLNAAGVQRSPWLTRGTLVGAGAGLVGNSLASMIEGTGEDWANEVAPIARYAGVGTSIGAFGGPWGALAGGLLGGGYGLMQGLASEDPLDNAGAMEQITNLATQANLSPENSARLSEDFALYTAMGLSPEEALQQSVQSIMLMRDENRGRDERQQNALAQQAIIASFMQPALEDAQHLNRTNIGQGYGAALVGQTHAMPVLQELAALQQSQANGTGGATTDDISALLGMIEG